MILKEFLTKKNKFKQIIEIIPIYIFTIFSDICTHNSGAILHTSMKLYT